MSSRTEKITQRTIAGLRSEHLGSRYFIRDTDLRGFGIVISPKGKANFIIEKRRRGARSATRKTIGDVDVMPLDQARIAAQEALLALSQGKDIRYTDIEEQLQPQSLAKAFDDILRDKRNSLKDTTLNDYKKTFNNVFKDWRPLPLDALTPDRVIGRYNDLIDQGKSAAYVNKCFRNLSSILSYHGLSPNPISVLTNKKIRKKNNVRTRFLSQSEIAAILKEHDWHTSAMKSMGGGQPKFTRVVIFCMLTGLRISEALNLTWKHIKDKKVEIPPEETKNKKFHSFPLVGMLERLVFDLPNSYQKRPNDKVFGYSASQYRRAQDQYMDNWKGNHWTSHDLRRTFSEHLNLVGYSESDIAVANNQSSTSVTGRHYLSGQLAKEQLQTKMFQDLQEQFSFYTSNVVSKTPQKAPENWIQDQLKFDDPFYGMSEEEKKRIWNNEVE